MENEDTLSSGSSSTYINQTAEILKLNNDCLECIVERLQDLRSEVAFARVCKRFQTICVRRWRASHSYDQLDIEEWRELLPNFEDLSYFITQMRTFIRTVYVTSCLCTLLKDLDEMQINVLPNVTRFFYDSEDIDCYPSDRSICQIAKMMPNLLCFRLTTPIHGHCLPHFRHLRELYLYEDQHKPYELRQEYLDQICRQLVNLHLLDIRTYDVISKLRLNNCVNYLQNLNTLKLNLATLKSVLPQVMALPALKELVVLLDTEWNIAPLANVDTMDHKIYEVREFYEIMEYKGSSIIGLTVDGYYMPLEPGWDEKLPIWTHQKLKSLAICSWPHQIDFLEQYTCMNNLQLLCLRNWAHLNDNMLLKFIEKCPQLRELDVSYCRELSPKFIEDSIKILKQREQDRITTFTVTQPLLLYYVLCGFADYVDAKNLQQSSAYSKYLIFINDFPLSSERGLSFVDRGYQFIFE